MVPIPSAHEEKFDIHYYPLKLRNTQDRIQKEEFSERDRKLLLSFGNFITANGVSIGRVTKYLNHLLVIKRRMKCDFEALDRKKVEELMAWVNNSDYKAWTKADMKGALKRFQKWVRCGTLDKDEPFPPEVSWIRTTLKRNELEEPTVLNGKEVGAMISVAHRTRDKAMLAVLHEGGFRVGELLGITMKDVVFDEHGARVSVKGKTGPRSVRVVNAAPLLAEWISQHPLRSKDAPLWVDMSNDTEYRPLRWLSLAIFYNILAIRPAVIETPRVGLLPLRFLCGCWSGLLLWCFLGWHSFHWC